LQEILLLHLVLRHRAKTGVDAVDELIGRESREKSKIRPYLFQGGFVEGKFCPMIEQVGEVIQGKWSLSNRCHGCKFRSIHLRSMNLIAFLAASGNCFFCIWSWVRYSICGLTRNRACR